MIKLTQEHIAAICHAELFLEGATEKMESRKMIQRIQNDRLKLTELKLYIIESMTQGSFTFTGPEDNVDEPGKSKSR